MNPNIKPSNRATVAALIDPDALTVGAHSSDWVDLATFGAIMAIAILGTPGASGTMDAKLEQATDGSGTGVKDIAGKAITQMATGDEQSIIDLFADELDVEGGFTHARLTITIGTADSDGAGLVQGFDARYQASPQAASVVEVV